MGYYRDLKRLVETMYSENGNRKVSIVARTQYGSSTSSLRVGLLIGPGRTNSLETLFQLQVLGQVEIKLFSFRSLV